MPFVHSHTGARLERLTGVVLALVLWGVGGCADRKSSPTDPAQPAPTAEGFARRVVALIGERRIDALAALVDPAHGLVFSPYAYVDRNSAVVLTPEALRDAWAQNAVLRFGFADGTGEPIDLPIREYFDRWLYGAEYAQAPRVAVNHVLGRGNSVNNLSDAFPDADFVEFHFPGFNAAYQGMDWRSLRVVVLRRTGGGWWLVGLVNDRWTI